MIYALNVVPIGAFGTVRSFAVAVAGVVVVEACGGGEVRRAGYVGGEEGAKSSDGDGGATRIFGSADSFFSSGQLSSPDV